MALVGFFNAILHFPIFKQPFALLTVSRALLLSSIKTEIVNLREGSWNFVDSMICKEYSSDKRRIFLIQNKIVSYSQQSYPL